MSKIRRYTDEEVGYIEETMNRRAAEVAKDLGTTRDIVYYLRGQVRKGWVREREPWTSDEKAILASGLHMTATQLEEKLPSRSLGAIKKMRQELKLTLGRGDSHSNPFKPAARSVIARTCLECGLLLPGTWFRWVKNGRRWASTCKKCEGDQVKDITKRNRARYQSTVAKYQAATIPHAHHSGQEYTERDEAVLADKSLTVLQKALRLGRTYLGTAGAIQNRGLTSPKKILGKPEQDQWIIDNPNAERIEEIIAMLKQTEPTTPTRPDFEWDD